MTEGELGREMLKLARKEGQRPLMPKMRKNPASCGLSIEQVKDLCDYGFDVHECAEMVGVTTSAIYKMAQRGGFIVRSKK